MWFLKSSPLFLLLSITVLLGQVSLSTAVYWPCATDTECNSVVGSTFCNDQGYCECPAGHVFSEDVSVCLAESLHGESCQEGNQCSHMLTGAVCSSSNQCTCREGLTYLQGRCRTLAPLHSDCQVDVDCSFGFDRESVVCQENKCQCANGFYERSENICRRILYNAGDVCTINADCQGLGPNHRCNNYKCEFTDEASQSSSSSSSGVKQQQRTLGVQTSIDIPKSQSTIGVNTSIDVPERDDEDEAKFGDACTETGEACPGLAHSECRRKQCQCSTGYYQRNGLCFAELGEVANTSSLCATVYRDGKCVCAYDQFYQPNMRTCLKTVNNINSICTAESQCTPFGEAYCHPTSPRRCVCRDYAVEDSAQQLCVKRVGFKQFCARSEDCADVPNTACDTTTNTCSCKANYYEENETCKPGINAECSADSDCGVSNSECSDDGAAAVTGTVKRVQETIAEEEEEDQENDETDERTGLLGGIDAPKRKKQLRKQSSVKIIASDSSSSSSPTVKSILSPTTPQRDEGKTCKCKSSFVPRNNECLETAEKFGDACKATEQCTPLLGELAECNAEGECVCKEEAHFNYNKCNKKVLLGDTCQRVSECFVEENPEEVQCRNAKCQCGFNSVMDTEQTKCVTASKKNSSSRPSPLKVITLLLIAAAVCVTSAAIRDAVSRSKGR